MHPCISLFISKLSILISLFFSKAKESLESRLKSFFVRHGFKVISPGGNLGVATSGEGVGLVLFLSLELYQLTTKRSNLALQAGLFSFCYCYQSSMMTSYRSIFKEGKSYNCLVMMFSPYAPDVL